ncbi:MAG: nucleotidyltransferase domain-containing protein [Acidobacteriaceae bacterium]
MLNELTKFVVNHYRNDRNVLGILLFGSQAKGAADRFSDVDFYVITNKPPKFTRDNFIKNGQRVDIIIEDIKTTKTYLKNDKGNVRRITSDMLSSAKIVYASSTEIKSLISQARANLKSKTKITRSELLMHQYSIDDFWGEVRRDAKKKDWIAFGIDSNLLVNNITELVLKLKGSRIVQPNQMNRQLAKTDRIFAGQLTNFFKSPSQWAKLATMKAMVEYVASKTPPFPEKWKI